MGTIQCMTVFYTKCHEIKTKNKKKYLPIFYFFLLDSTGRWSTEICFRFNHQQYLLCRLTVGWPGWVCLSGFIHYFKVNEWS